MKKSKFLSLLGTLIVPTLLLGALFTGTKFSQPTIKASANVGEKYIPFNAANFTVNTNPVGFNDADDWVTGRYGTFWTHRYFNALDNFYDGFRNEGWTGTVTSRTWTHTGGYLSFTLGGNPFDGANVVNRVAVMAGTTEIASIHNNAFQDPSLSLNMIVKVVDIPTQYINAELHLEIIDGKAGGFGGITFGALKVNQTALEVTRTVKTHQVSLASIDTDTVDAHKNSLAKTVTLSAYSADSVYTPFLNTTLTSVNEDFEVNGMTNWGYDIDYSQISTENTDKYLGINFGTAVSSDTTFFDEDVPFNKEGTSFYNGWAAVSTDEEETAKYRYLSAPMTVTGSGIMSVKMGGRTSELQILNKDTLVTLATFRNPSFNDVPGLANIVSSGTRLATMTRVVVDAKAFLNQEVVIALADAEPGGGWGVAFFDELVTQYAVAPSFKLDLLSHQGENGVIKDMFLGADGSDIKAAYTFLQGYYSALRASDNDFTYCSLLDGDPSVINTKLSQYDGLTSGARAIVDGSQDYSYGLVAGDGNFLHNPVDLTDVGSSINYMRANVGTSGSQLRNIPATVKSDSIILVTLIALASITALALYFNVKKTKRD